MQECRKGFETFLALLGHIFGTYHSIGEIRQTQKRAAELDILYRNVWTEGLKSTIPYFDKTALMIACDQKFLDIIDIEEKTLYYSCFSNAL